MKDSCAAFGRISLPETDKEKTMEHKEYAVINQPIRKKDSMQLLLGKPAFTEDLAPKDALVVKLLRSPHATAIVESVDSKAARLVPGVVDIFTWEDVPKTRYAIEEKVFFARF